MMREAVISPCGLYRFYLARQVTPLFHKVRTVAFGLLNPSKADAEIDDATVRKGWAYTRAWDCHRMVFVNTNPYRSTDPKSARTPPESVLLENDEYLRRAAREAAFFVCAWSTKVDPELAVRATRVLQAVAPLHILEMSVNGYTPKHPLYLRGNLQPTLWRPQATVSD